MIQELPIVGIFLPGRGGGSRLANELKSDHVYTFAVTGTDAFHELVSRQRLDVLVIAQNIECFLTGLEIVERLQAELRHPAVILIGPVTDSQKKKAALLGVTTIVDDVSDSDRITSAVRSRIAQLRLGGSAVTPAARKFVAHANVVQPMPQLLTKLCTYLQNDLVSLDALADDIACDPRVTAELLKLINSTSVGLSRKITSVPEAVRFLGVRKTIATVIATGVLRSQSALCHSLPESMRAWYRSRSLLIACTAAAVAEGLENLSGETAHVLGLLQDLGALVLAQVSPKRYEQLLHRVTTIGHLKLEHLEREEFGVTHAEVSAALLERWELPESLVAMVLDHHGAGSRPGRPGIEEGFLQAMRIAEAVANATENRVPQRYQVLAGLLAKYGTARAEDCKYCFAKAALKAREQAKLFAIPLPSAVAVETALAQFASSLPEIMPDREKSELIPATEGDTDRAPQCAAISAGADTEVNPKRTVLAIADSPEILRAIKRTLISPDYTVRQASTVTEAVSQGPLADVVVCDVQLTCQHGADLVAEIRRAGVTAPVIMLSGDCSRETVTRCIAAGIDAYLVKPFTSAELLDKVRTCCFRIRKFDGPVDGALGVIPIPAQKLRVLIVEDDNVVQNVCSRLLTRRGFECEAVADAESASRLCAANGYDAVVTDLKLPGMSGLQLCDELLERPNRPIIAVLTGDADPDIRVALLERGVDLFLTKPHSPKTLGESLKRLATIRPRHRDRQTSFA